METPLMRRSLPRIVFACSFIAVCTGPARASTSLVPSSDDDCAKTIRSRRQALAASPADPNLERALADSLASCGQSTEAIARYQNILQRQPDNMPLRLELGNVLRRAGRSNEAIPLFRQLLAENPDNFGATLGLAESLAATGNYTEALLRYDAALKLSTDNYEALQGKAYALYWSRKFAAAQTIFERLRQRNPQDRENSAALAAIARAELGAGLPPGASLEDSLVYYQKRLKLDPRDRSALLGVARVETELKSFPSAIESYRKLRAAAPEDHDLRLRLALALSWNGEYAESIREFRGLLKEAPADLDALQGLAHASFWSGAYQDALAADEQLLARDPSNPQYLLDAARAEIGLGKYADAQQSLRTLLLLRPEDRAARLELGQVYLKRRRWAAARKQFEAVLRLDPRDTEALFNATRSAYYEGRIGKAYAAGAALVREDPGDFDAVMLLAHIERARGHRRRVFELLTRADRLSPGNHDVDALRERLSEEPPYALETVASYAREIGRPTSAASQALLAEDLRSFAYGSTFTFPGIPYSQPHLLLSYVPSNSPSGGDQGTVAPAEFEYWQATRPIAPLTVRAGIGLARFGPGAAVPLPSSAGPQPGATSTPIGFVGGSFALNPNTSFDLTWSRSAILYTPLTVRLGVTSNRTEAGVSLKLDPRTDLRVSYFGERDTTESYAQVTTVINPNTHLNVIANAPAVTQGTGGAVLFNHHFKHSSRFALDGGYSGLAYGYDAARRGVFLGFFTPSLYQRHLLTARVSGALYGPLSYDFLSGLGVQQVGARQALTRALLLNPAFTLKASPRISFTLGYTYYNVAQTLGLVSGNGVRLTTDWRF